MYKQKYVLLLMGFLFGTFLKTFSQISVVPATGCLPAGITNALFTYTGTGTPANVVWNYGDGTPTSSLPSTQHSYPNVGSYIVTYNATIGGSPVTYTYLVTVHPPPAGNFNMSVPASHCRPMNVTFTASSSNNNVVYTWAYGDLGGGNGPVSAHMYNTPGSFTPNVTIQNTLTGCFVTVYGNAVHVSSEANLFILPSPGQSTCAPSFTASFDVGNSTTGSPLGGGLTYQWNFGPFGSSTQPNSGNIVFAPAGLYGVTLTATDNNNCVSTKSLQVNLLSPTVTAIVPPTVCIGGQEPAQFSVTVNSNRKSTKWHMGDGTVLAFPIPQPPPLVTFSLIPNTPYTSTIHVYMSPGPKIVTVTATDGQCTDTTTVTIFVEEVTPSFVSLAPTITCSPVFTVGYTNQSTVNSGSPLSYTWNVSDWHGNPSTYTSTALNPVFTVTQTSNSPYVNYYRPPYHVHTELEVVSQPAGCKTKFKMLTDTIQRPTARFEILNQAEGCAPLAVTFTDTSIPTLSGLTGNTILYGITNYTWNFGESPTSLLSGATVPGPVPIPPASYTYNNPGTYLVTLSITTTGGCSHASYEHTVTVVNPAAIQYTLPSPATACLGEPFTLTVSANPTTAVQHWHFESDDGYFSSCITDKEPAWEFNHYGSGSHTFTISAYEHGCKSTQVTTPVTVRGPLGKMAYETSCSTPTLVKFYYQLEDVQSATIDFGDGQSQQVSGVTGGSVSGIAMHSYTPGIYTATITSSNTPTGCNPYTYTAEVKVNDFFADFVFTNSVICQNQFFKADAAASVGVFTTQGRGYTWFVDDEPPLQRQTTTVTTSGGDVVGTHTLTLLVKNENGCLLKVSKNFRVSAPAPEFTFNTNPVCYSSQLVPGALQMMNLTPQSPDPIKQNMWVMGDSVLYSPPNNFHTVLTSTVSNFSPSFTYLSINGKQTFTFAIKLITTNTIGCSSSKTHTLMINDPLLSTKIDKDYGCAPEIKTFSFTAGPTHANYSLYYGEGVATNITSFNTASVYTSSHYYASPGSYTCQFVLTDIAGCQATKTLALKIEAAPPATFTFENVINHIPGPGPFCAPFSPSATSTAQSPFPVVYTWDLGLNGPMSSTASSATDNYPDSEGNYTISLVIKTMLAGCASSTMVPVRVFSPKIKFRIEPDSMKDVFCLGDPIQLNVTSFSGIPDGYQYDFGDGVVTPRRFPVAGVPQTLLTSYPNLYYPENTNGMLNIQLVGYAGQDPTICKDVQYKTVQVVRVLADFDRNEELGESDWKHCVGKTEVFKNKSSNSISSAMTYTWIPGDGSGEQNGEDVTHVYGSPGTYTVLLKAFEPANGCVGSTGKTMVIFPNPTSSMSAVPFSCPQIPFVVQGSGSPGVSGTLTGTLEPGGIPLSFDGANTFSLSTTASVSTTYTLKVTDNNGCENAANPVSVFVQQPAPVVHWDTTVVIGQPVPLNAYAGPDFSYTWTPLTDYLDCDTCLIYNPVSTSTVNITYSVAVQDGKQCSVVSSTYRIHIELKVSIDVPSAFTPNGDGINDVIFPAGWGLKKLNFFRVYNRWGQLLFETNDLDIGWDGVASGVPQNMETYVYQVSAETYSDNQPTVTRSGTFKLLR